MQGSGEVRRWCKDLENLKGRKAALRVLMNLPCVTLCFGAFFGGGLSPYSTPEQTAMPTLVLSHLFPDPFLLGSINSRKEPPVPFPMRSLRGGTGVSTGKTALK